jgi:tRNA (cytidine56-2'-O)-methyltransferase
MPIEVLRLSHRIRRDPRISTHVALTARAFLADKIYYSGQHDSSLENSVNKITKEFGSNFEIEFVKNPIRLIKKKKDYTIVHLSMYSIQLQKKLKEIKKNKNILIIIGSEKVSPEIYELANFNISITSQPISEVSALAIFLHELQDGKELNHEFKNSKKKIIPQERGKKVKEF